MQKESTIQEISKRIGELFGLQYSEVQYDSLIKNLRNITAELKVPFELEAVNDWLNHARLSPDELNTIAKHLSVGETYFFREKSAIDFFKEKFVSDFIANNKSHKTTLNIWSAGCSSGEEPYTLAILLRELIPDIQNFSIRILATDININALNKAKSGKYTEWSFRETPESIKSKYFRAQNKHYQIKEEIKQMVSFEQLNLATFYQSESKTVEETFDIIFCRNVLMYFLPEVAKNITAYFYKALKPEAWLITSQVELIDEYYLNFKRQNLFNGIFYQKHTPIEAENTIIDTIKTLTSQQRPGIKLKPGKKPVIRSARKTAKQVKVNKTVKQTTEKTTGEQALALFNAGKYPDYIAYCENDLHSIKNNEHLSFLYINALANTGQLQKAANIASDFVTNNTVNDNLLNLYATILMELKDWEKAKTVLTKSLYLNHEAVSTHFNLGIVYQKLGNQKQASKYFQNVLSILEKMNDDTLLPELDNITAGRLYELTKMMSTP